MVINTNITSQISANMLAASSANLAKSLQRLSSGSKIVSPEDDAAGLAVSMKFTAQSARLAAAANNVSNAISFSQTQDGFLQKVSKALDRMSELSVAAQDVTKNSDDLALYDKEYQELAAYVDDVATKEFNGVALFSASTLDITTDSESTSTPFTMTGVDVATTTSSVTGLDITTVGNAKAAQTALETAITDVAGLRAQVGANLSHLNYASDQLAIQKTNIDAANSRIIDVDVAQESTNYAKQNILVQSGTAMLAQANAMPQSVLKLLS